MEIQKNSPNWIFVDYGYALAKQEGAICDLRLNLLDSAVQFERKGMVTLIPKLSQAKQEEARAAIFSAISTELSVSLLQTGLKIFQEKRKENPYSKLLIVNIDQAHAKKTERLLASWDIDVATAVSADREEGLDAMRRFKTLDTVPILNSVKMAFEGFDVPEIETIICLSNIRGRVYLEQLFGRGLRVCRRAGAPSDQICDFVGPDDPLLREVAEEIRQEIISPVKEVNAFGEPRGGFEQSSPFEIVPIKSTPMARPTRLDFYSGQPLELVQLKSVAEEVGIDASDSQLEALRNQLIQSQDGPDLQLPPSLKQREDALRSSIELLVRKISFYLDQSPEEINRSIKARFGKPRNAMTLQDLRGVHELVSNYYSELVKDIDEDK